MTLPVFQEVGYIDPWGTIPPGTSSVGVLVTIANADAAPGETVLILRLLQGVAPLAYGVGGSPGFAYAKPPAPLTAAQPYLIQAQWVPRIPTPEPANADWTNANVVGAPVLTSALMLTAGSIAGGQAAFSWSGLGSAAPGYGMIKIFDVTDGHSVAFVEAAGGSGAVAFAPVRGRLYTAYITGAALLDRQVAKRYTYGPSAPPLPLPTAAPTLTGVAYDGATLAVAWTPPAPPSAPVVAHAAYALVLRSGDTLLARFPAAAGGGAAALHPALLGGAVTVAGSVSYGPIEGPVGAGQPLITAAPAIAGVTLAAAAQGQTEVTVGVALAAAHPGNAIVQVQLLQDGAVIAAGQADGTPLSAKLTAALPAGHRYAVAAYVTAAAKNDTPALAGPSCAPVPVLARTPTIAFGELRDDVLRLRWSATGEDGVRGYQVCAGATCATTTAEEIALALPPGAAPQTVTVTPVGVATTGLASSVAVVAPLTVQSGSYAGGRLSLTPSAVGTTSPALLQLDVLIDGAPAARMQASTPVNDQLEVPVALPPGVCAAVRLSGVGAGPLAPTSAAATIPSTPPAHVAAAYDGAELHIAWQPTAEPGVSGYLITVAGATPPVAARYVAGAGTNTTTIAATFPDPFPGAAAVTVRASAAVAGSTNGRIDGPTSASTAPTLAPSVRAISVHASAQPPYLLRHGAYVTRGGAEMGAIAVYLENVFTSDHPSPVTDGHTPPIFTLVSLPPPVSGPPCRLTIDKSVWSSFDGTAARAALRTSHREFLRKLEAAGVVAGAVALLREAIASALPQTFTETLYYRYGVWQEPALRTLDLSPGMRLRLGGAAYQAPAATTVDPRNGFVALGDEQYELAEVFPVGSGQSALAPALTIDAFLSSLIPGAGGRSTTVAASAYDFFGLGARQAYFRLFYPSALAASGSIGSTAAKDNVLVIGAPSWEALESATETYADRGEAPLTGDIFAAYFRGRALLTPLVAVTIDGRERWVPLGTSVRQLLAAAGAPAVGPSAGAQLRMTRPAPAISDWARGAVAIHAEPVDLSTAELGGAVPQLWPIDLPLLGGDALTLVPAP